MKHCQKFLIGNKIKGHPVKTSKAFKLTLDNLWGGTYNPHGYRYICHAAKSAGVDDIVIPIITNLLGRRNCLEDWIRDSGLVKNFSNGVYPAEYTWNAFLLKMQITRKAWLESLIAEYELIGD